MGCGRSAAVRADCPECVDASRKQPAFEDEYFVSGMIGSGAFGKVYAATRRSTGEPCAVKLVELADVRLSQEKQVEQARRVRRKAKAELQAWQAVGKHPNIVELQGWFMDRSSLVLMVMERCSRNVLEMLSSGDASRIDSRWLLRQLLLGVHACHQAWVCHRDIKAQNFLIGEDGRRVKLCDFGLAAVLAPPGAIDGPTCLQGVCGTPQMMSPEMLQGKPYDLGTDAWSFGATAYLVLFREFPYIPTKHSSKAAKKAVLIGEPKPRFLEGELAERDQAAAGFLRGLLEREPVGRVTATEALGHPYLQVHGKPEVCRSDSASTTAPTEDNVACPSFTESQAGGGLSPVARLSFPGSVHATLD